MYWFTALFFAGYVRSFQLIILPQCVHNIQPFSGRNHADPTRMRILLLLSRGEMHGQALAKKLNLSQPTVTHHASKLREAGLIKERRDKNTVYFTLNPELIRRHAEATVRFIFEKGEGAEEMSEPNETLEATVLRNFLAKDGKLRQIPAQYKKKLIVLQMLAEKLEPGRVYPER